jgi:hypothetical protein
VSSKNVHSPGEGDQGTTTRDRIESLGAPHTSQTVLCPPAPKTCLRSVG